MISDTDFELMPETLPRVTSACKWNVPRGNVTPRNIARMKQNEWRHLDNAWERVKWARVHWQKKTGQPAGAEAAAAALQMKAGTYRAYERGPESSKNIPLNYVMAKKFANKFQVSWQWLLNKLGSPFDINLPPNVPMMIMIRAEFDPESQSWWAAADIDEKHVLATGAGTFEELLERIPVVLRDLLVDTYPDIDIPFSVVAIAHKTGVVNTRVA